MSAIATEERQGALRVARPATCQMFETPLIERFSRINPVMPFAFWLPVLGYFAYRTVARGTGPIPHLALVLAGLCSFGRSPSTSSTATSSTTSGRASGSGASTSSSTAFTTIFRKTPIVS